MADTRSKASQRLVIDASVAQSAGDLSAQHPVSTRCRDFLKAVLEICHHLVMTPEIDEEWKKHASRFARTWRVEMFVKEKVDWARVFPQTELRAKVCDETAEDQRCIMLKDWHLIEAAMATDRIIVSRDDTARGLFSGVSKTVGEIRKVIWVNPVEELDPCSWLEKGASAEDRRMLGKAGEST